MRNSKEVERELYSAGVPPYFELLWDRKVRLFPENLADNEHIVAGVRGYFRELKGRLVATESRLLFLERKGLFGSVVESFPYSRIDEVATSKDILRGDLIINSGGSSETIKGIQQGLLSALPHCRAAPAGRVSSGWVKCNASFWQRCGDAVRKARGSSRLWRFDCSRISDAKSENTSSIILLRYRPAKDAKRRIKSHWHLTPSRAVDLSGDIATLTAR
jgi:Bacterial PH domain